MSRFYRKMNWASEPLLKRDYQKKPIFSDKEKLVFSILAVFFALAFCYHVLVINHDPLFDAPKAHAEEIVPSSVEAACAYAELYPEKVSNPEKSPCP